MRKGFTMIELIFVIVILGILAAVAIPKLAATRDDAEITKGLQEISMAVQDLTSHYTAHGKFADTLTEMSNVPLTGKVTTNADGVPSGTVKYQTKNQGGKVDCVDIEVKDVSETIGTGATATKKSKYALILKKDTSAKGSVCTGIIESKTFKDMAYSKNATGGYDETKSREYVISGSNVSF